MKNKGFLKFALLGFLLLFGKNLSSAQTTLYLDNFSGEDNKGTIGVTTDLTGVDWSVNTSAGVFTTTSDYFAVKSGQFETRDVDGEVIFTSETFSINGYTNLKFIFDAGANGDFEASGDLFEVRIYIDETPQLIFEGNIDEDAPGDPMFFGSTQLSSTLQNFSTNILSTGTNAYIEIKANNNTGTEEYFFDNLEVQGMAVSPNPIIAFDSSESDFTETVAKFATAGIPITLTNYNTSVTITPTINGSSTAESEDYTIDLTPLVFDANETLTIPLSINPDDDFENETIVIDFTVTSGNATIETSTHTVTISDIDENSNVTSLVTTIDFETENSGYTPSATEGSTFIDVFNRIDRTGNALGGNNTFLFAIEDTNLSNPYIQLDQIDVSGATSFTFSIDMLAHHYNDWDNNDELLITYSIDNGAYQNLLWVQSITEPSSSSNEPAAVDTDFDGSGECVNVLPSISSGTGTLGCVVSNSDFTTFTTPSILLASNSTLDIKLQFNGLTAADEGLYIDNIIITETADSTNTDITFDLANSSETETDTTFETSGIPITLTNYGTNVTITPTINESSTAEAEDYIIDLTPLVFDANETLTIPLSINSDDDFEDETIIIDFTVTSGNANLGITTHTVTISDDEVAVSPTLIITEVADTNDNDNARFIEIYNNGSIDIDFSITPIYISRFTNGNPTATSSNVEKLDSGTLLSKHYLVIGSSGTNFSTAYGFSPDEINSGFKVNGDDPFGMYSGIYPNGTLFDVYGEIGVDGSGENWEYENKRAIRNNLLDTPSTTWQSSSWSIVSANVADATPGASENEFRYDGNWKPRDISNATLSDNVFISSSVSLSSNLEVNNFEIRNSATVTINSGVALKVNGTSSGNVTYNRTLNSNQWYLISSPVKNQGIANFYNNEPNLRLGSGSSVSQNIAIAKYDNSKEIANNRWSYYSFGEVDGVNNDDTNDYFANGTGYSISLSSSEDISFTGTIPTSNQFFSLAHGGTNNFNLIGNTFTSFFTLGNFYETGTNSTVIDTDFYFWNGSQYITRTSGANSSFEIAPGQGFFVESLFDGTISFEASNLTIGNGDTFSKSLDYKNRPEITLTILEGKNKRFATIIYSDVATLGYDKGYDGKLFTGITNDFVIYTDLIDSDSKKYQLQALPNSNYEGMIIPIGLVANSGKEISFNATSLNLPEGIKVYLEDKLTNTFTRLDEENSEYTISLNESLNGIGRFYLHTKTNVLNIKNLTSLSNVSVYQIDNVALRIVGLSKGFANIKLFSILGKQVINSSFISNGVRDITLPNLTSGVYVMQLETEYGKINKKITLQ